MLKLSFLGYKTSFKAWYTHRGLVPALKHEDIYRDGGRESFRSYESYKTPKTVMGEEEEEGMRTMEDKYKELTAHFASISLVTPPLDAHKRSIQDH